MQKNRMTDVRDYIIRHSKFVFPVLVIAAVAITVSIALNASNAKAELAGSIRRKRFGTIGSGKGKGHGSPCHK